MPESGVDLLVMAPVWEFATRNWALLSIATTLVLLTVFPAIILRKYVRIALNIMDDFAPPVLPDSRESLRQDGKPVRFSAFDGHLLNGTILPAIDAPRRKGLIIFAHEFGVDRWSCYPFVQPLRTAGFDVLAFDFRGHGDSPSEAGYKPRQFPSDREQADMLGAIAYAEHYLQEHHRPRELGLFGLSRGAGASILAAVGIESVKCIAVDGAFSSDKVMEYLLKRWASIFARLRFVYENHPPSFWRFLRWLIFVQTEKKFGCGYPSVAKALRRLRCKPLFFIHGERDSIIPVEQTEMLYSLAWDPKYLWTIPRARHNQSVVQQPQEYARRITAFFDRYLAGQEAAERNAAVLDAAVLSDLTQPVASEAEPQRRRVVGAAV